VRLAPAGLSDFRLLLIGSFSALSSLPGVFAFHGLTPALGLEDQIVTKAETSAAAPSGSPHRPKLRIILYPLFPDSSPLFCQHGLQAPVCRFIPDVHGSGRRVGKSITPVAWPLMNHYRISRANFEMGHFSGRLRGKHFKTGLREHFRHALGWSRDGGCGTAHQADSHNPDQNDQA
jgi:hypothetical protein